MTTIDFCTVAKLFSTCEQQILTLKLQLSHSEVYGRYCTSDALHCMGHCTELFCKQILKNRKEMELSSFNDREAIRIFIRFPKRWYLYIFIWHM